MQIHGPAHVHGPQSVARPHNSQAVRSSDALAPDQMGDTLELSDAGQIAAQIAELPDVRQDRIAEIRQAIAQGGYESQEKISVAVDKLLDEIG